MDYKDLRMQTRLIDSLILFYVALSANFLVYLYPKDHIEYIRKNKFIRYLLGFITMLFSIYHISSLSDPREVIVIAISLYAWFLMSTRLHPIYNVFIISVLSFCFMINIKIEDLQSVNYTNETRVYINRLKTMVMSLFLFVLIVTIIAYIYMKI